MSRKEEDTDPDQQSSRPDQTRSNQRKREKLTGNAFFRQERRKEKEKKERKT